MRTWILPATIMVLALLSLVVLSSIAPTLAPRQAVFFLLGGAVFYAASSISFSRYQQSHWLGFWTTIALLILTQVLGQVTRSTTSWFTIGGLFAVQPSQLAVPLVGLSAAVTAARLHMSALLSVGKYLLLIGVPTLLILTEPDLGTTVIFVGGMLSILWLAPTRLAHLLGLVAAGLILIFISWQFLAPYQQARISSFVSSEDPRGAGYNARQSLIAVGSGGVWGRGLGQGVQSHLRFLPERQTDFIFASLAEEFGLLGSLLVLSLYAAVVFTLVRTGVYSDHPAAQYFCLAMATALFLQIMVNIGMNTGIMPITGITLPLLSYGGSSVIATCGMLGIVQGIVRQMPKSQAVLIS